MPARAWVRPPSAGFVNALSRHPEKSSLNFPRALEQHRHYVSALEQAGLEVHRLDPLDEFPDAVFIEDNALLLEDGILICPMAEASRKGETEHTRNDLKKWFPILEWQSEATLDGGDILQTGETLFVGQSRRTGPEAVSALAHLTSKPVAPVTVHRGLHLKSAVSWLGRNTLLIDPSRVDTDPFRNFEWIEVEAVESYAANCLTVGNTVILAEGYPGVQKKIEDHGWNVVTVPMSEFEKADGGITCLSLID